MSKAPVSSKKFRLPVSKNQDYVVPTSSILGSSPYYSSCTPFPRYRFSPYVPIPSNNSKASVPSINSKTSVPSINSKTSVPSINSKTFTFSINSKASVPSDHVDVFDKNCARYEISLRRLSCFQNYFSYHTQVSEFMKKETCTSTRRQLFQHILNNASIAFKLLNIPRNELIEKSKQNLSLSRAELPFKQLLIQGVIKEDSEIMNLIVKRLMQLQMLANSLKE